ncbi:Permease, MFS superfamily [Gordonia sp. KTR9]|nr:Permease, MFS superfamily [Gordonia sp. KTR9]
MFAAFTALPQFLQSPETDGFGFGASTTIAGLMIMPISAGMFVLGLLAGRLTRRFGARLLLIGGSLVASAGYLALAAAHTVAGLIYLWCTIVGVGLGLAFSAVSNLVIAAVPPEQTGAVSGMNVNIRTVGGAVGAALMASLVAIGSDSPGAPSDVGYTIGFVMIAVAVALSAAAAAVAPSR